MSDRDKIADLLYQAIFKGKIECYRDCEKLSDQILGLLDKPSGLETVKTVMWNTKYPGAHVDEVADEIGIYDCPCSFVYSPGTEECDWCHYDRKCGH